MSRLVIQYYVEAYLNCHFKAICAVLLKPNSSSSEVFLLFWSLNPINQLMRRANVLDVRRPGVQRRLQHLSEAQGVLSRKELTEKRLHVAAGSRRRLPTGNKRQQLLQEVKLSLRAGLTLEETQPFS